jgi:hypothetical protein
MVTESITADKQNNAFDFNLSKLLSDISEAVFPTVQHAFVD